MANVTEADLLRVRQARVAGWQRMARELPNHRILAVELLRTKDDETVALITVARREIVQYAIRGDANGRVPRNCDPTPTPVPGQPTKGAALSAVAAKAAPPPDPDDPNAIPLGEPPVKEPPPPGIAALGEALLATAFGVGENIPV